MSEAFFFYNTTTQRTSLTKIPVRPRNSPQTQADDPHSDKGKGSSRLSKVSSSSSKGTQSSHGRGDDNHNGDESDRMTGLTASPLSPLKKHKGQNESTSNGALSKTATATGQHNYGPGFSATHSIHPADLRAGLYRTDSNGRTASMSSNSVTASSTRTSANTSDSAPMSDAALSNPFTKIHGRRYLRDPTNPYPLPCDINEMHRQTLRTMLLVQVFGSPVCSPSFQNKPPKKVLEIACGTGYWSSLCHQHFSRKGHSVSFTGIDIVPLAPDMSKDEDMRWRFVQHDLRKTPLPFSDEEFDLVMVKDCSLIVPLAGTQMQQSLMDEYLRVLRPGGSIEIWDGDHTLRMLLPHTPSQAADEDDSDSEDEEQERANSTGTYILSARTPFKAPLNKYLVDYNNWLGKALEQRKLTHIPCTHIRPMLLQESEDLIEIESRRLAIPLGEVRWEREGIGSATTTNSSERNSQGSIGKAKAADLDKRVLSKAQIALRRTALLTVVQGIEALEPVLREASGKGQDEWDKWTGNMMSDLLKSNGSNWGECLEVGAWWAKKKKPMKSAKDSKSAEGSSSGV